MGITSTFYLRARHREGHPRSKAERPSRRVSRRAPSTQPISRHSVTQAGPFEFCVPCGRWGWCVASLAKKQATWKECCLPRKQSKEATLLGHALTLARQPARGLAAWRCVSCGLSSSSLRRLACTPSAPLSFVGPALWEPQAVASANGSPISLAHSAENRLHPVLLSQRHGSLPFGEAHGIRPAGLTAPAFSTNARRSLGRGPGRPKQPKHRLCLPIASSFFSPSRPSGYASGYPWLLAALGPPRGAVPFCHPGGRHPGRVL